MRALFLPPLSVRRILNEAVSPSLSYHATSLSLPLPPFAERRIPIEFGFPRALLTVTHKSQRRRRHRRLVSLSLSLAQRPCMREFLSLGYRDTVCFSGVGFKGETAKKSWKFADSLFKGGLLVCFLPFNLSMHWHGVLDHVQFRVWLWRRRRYRIIA